MDPVAWLVPLKGRGGGDITALRSCLPLNVPKVVLCPFSGGTACCRTQVWYVSIQYRLFLLKSRTTVCMLQLTERRLDSQMDIRLSIETKIYTNLCRHNGDTFAIQVWSNFDKKDYYSLI